MVRCGSEKGGLDASLSRGVDIPCEEAGER